MKPFVYSELFQAFRIIVIAAAITGSVAMLSKAEITIRIDYLNIPLEVAPEDEAQTTDDLKV